MKCKHHTEFYGHPFRRFEANVNTDVTRETDLYGVFSFVTYFIDRGWGGGWNGRWVGGRFYVEAAGYVTVCDVTPVYGCEIF